MNAAEKWEEIIDALTKLTSPEFMLELDMKDGLKALDDLVWETYTSPDEELYGDNEWDDELAAQAELEVWDERDER
jgi:hypothetical protein